MLLLHPITNTLVCLRTFRKHIDSVLGCSWVNVFWNFIFICIVLLLFFSFFLLLDLCYFCNKLFSLPISNMSTLLGLINIYVWSSITSFIDFSFPLTIWRLACNCAYMWCARELILSQVYRTFSSTPFPNCYKKK